LQDVHERCGVSGHRERDAERECGESGEHVGSFPAQAPGQSGGARRGYGPAGNTIRVPNTRICVGCASGFGHAREPECTPPIRTVQDADCALDRAGSSARDRSYYPRFDVVCRDNRLPLFASTTVC
jgi:hypothetical protein